MNLEETEKLKLVPFIEYKKEIIDIYETLTPTLHNRLIRFFFFEKWKNEENKRKIAFK